MSPRDRATTPPDSEETAYVCEALAEVLADELALLREAGLDPGDDSMEKRRRPTRVDSPAGARAEESETEDLALMSAPSLRPDLDKRAAAAYLGKSVRVLDRLRADGLIASYRVGGAVRFARADLDSYILSCRKEAKR